MAEDFPEDKYDFKPESCPAVRLPNSSCTLPFQTTSHQPGQWREAPTLEDLKPIRLQTKAAVSSM